MSGRDKSQQPINLVVAYALWLMMGLFGVHRFYTGHKRTGLLQVALFAVALFLFNKVFYVVGGWWVVDLFLVPFLCRIPFSRKSHSNTQDQKEENDFQAAKRMMFEAKTMYEKDELDAADQLLQTAAPLLEHQTDLDLRLFFASLLNSRGLIHEKLERIDEAEVFFRQSIASYEQNTSGQGDNNLIIVHSNLAHVFLKRQQPEGAKEMLEKIFRQISHLSLSNTKVRAIGSYIDCLINLKSWELARTYCEQMIALLEHSQDTSDKGLMVDNLCNLAEITLAQEKFSVAIQHLNKADELRREIEQPSSRLRENPDGSSTLSVGTTRREAKISGLFRKVTKASTAALLKIRQDALHDLLEVICWNDTAVVEAAYEQLVGQLEWGVSSLKSFDYNAFALKIRSTLSRIGHILHFDHNEGVELILQGIQNYAHQHGIGGRLLDTSYECFDEEDEDYPIPFFSAVNDMMAEQGFELWNFFLFDDSFTIFFTRKEETEAKKLKIAAYRLGFTEENTVMIFQG